MQNAKLFAGLTIGKYTYNPATGLFTITKTGRVVSAGSGGYVQLYLPHGKVAAHRIAWLLIYGKLPHFQIDHINRIKSDNRIENLREATPAQNRYNSRTPTGKLPEGVRKTPAGRYSAKLRYMGITKYLGTFSSVDAASERVQQEKRKLHGDFYVQP